MLNTDNENRHFIAGLMTQNRTLRMIKENKLGPKPTYNKKDKHTMKTLTYKSIDIYNKLDRKFTLLINTVKFKKCLNKLSSNPKVVFKIKLQKDYDPKCYKDYNDDIFIPCMPLLGC